MFIVAPTDLGWFNYLNEHRFNEAINFWTPSDWHFNALKPGEKVVFKLKGSGEAMAGGYASFIEYRFSSIDEAWSEFGRKNGFDNKASFVQGLTKYNPDAGKSGIGCLVLGEVFFFDNPVKLSDFGINFSRSIVKYKKYDTDFPFDENSSGEENDFTLVVPVNKKKRQQSMTQREGQPWFHTRVCRAYGQQCCISGEDIPELLQAAHIQEYINSSSNHVQNGLLLRVDLHTLFDNGLLAVDENYIIHISPLVKSDEYRKYDGTKITLPKDRSNYPSVAALKYKMESFRA